MNYSLANRFLLIPCWFAITVVAALSTACSTTVETPDKLELIQNRLGQLQAKAELSTRVPNEFHEAQEAIKLAQKSHKNERLKNHSLVMANYKLDIANTISQLVETPLTNVESQKLEKARAQAALAWGEAEPDHITIADIEGYPGNKNVEQIHPFNKPYIESNVSDSTVILGDKHFMQSGDMLKILGVKSLANLVLYFNSYPELKIIVDTHVDINANVSVLALSKRRIDNVKHYLMGRGINPERFTTFSKGENIHLAYNEIFVGQKDSSYLEVLKLEKITSR